MSRIVILKNVSGSEQTFNGQTFSIDQSLDVSNETHAWENSDIFSAIGTGDLCVGDGSTDFTDSIRGWNWLKGDTTPMSHLGDRIAVHASSRPEKGKDFYLVWTSSGDDLANDNEVGGGDMIQITTTAVGTVAKEAHFNVVHGDVYLHEAYAKWESGGEGDNVVAEIFAPATSIQTAANKDLILDGNWIKYSPGGPGTGTHGFGATPFLVPRTFSKDGDWDYDASSGSLTPNFTGTGGYKISDIARPVNRYINKLPISGNSYGFVTLTSDETAYLPPGYFIRVTLNNVSGNATNFCAFFEVFRERTNVP